MPMRYCSKFLQEEYFAKNDDHIYNVRHKSKILQSPLHKTNPLEKCSFYMEMKFLNKIPNGWNIIERDRFYKVLKALSW